MRIKIIATLLCAAAAAAAQAAPQYGPAYGYRQAPLPGAYGMPSQTLPQAEEESPAAQLRDGVNKLLGFMRREERPSDEELARFLEKEIAPFFDFAYMAQVAAGGAYRHMSEEQRTRMTERLKEQFLGTLAERLGGFEDQDVRFLASRLNPDGRTGSASIAVLNPNAYPARIDFRFYRKDGGWKVYDVAVEGVSLVINYRSSFGQEIKRNGIDGLIGRLAEKNRGNTG